MLSLTVALALLGQIQDPGFETPQLGPGKFRYSPIEGSAWSFVYPAGLAANNSGFTANNPVAPEGQQVAYLQSTGGMSQQVTLAAGSVVTLKAAQRNYPQGGAKQDFAVQLDGQTVGTVKPASTNYETYYVILPPTAEGVHTLNLQGLNTAGGDNTAFLDAVSISTSIATPVSVDDVWVGSSGKTIGFRFGGAVPTQIINGPSIYRNGEFVGLLSPAADMTGNEVLLYPLPQGVQVGTGDTISVSTPPVWQNTTVGLVAPLRGQRVDNRVGRSPLPPRLLDAKTLKPGVNNNTWPTGPWGNYYPFKNWAFKCTWPPSDMGRLKGSGTLRVYSNAGNNGIDQTGYPGPKGLWLVYWKGSGSTFSLTTHDPASTVVTERTDLANPAAPDGYQGRVFDFQQASGSTVANIDVALTFNTGSAGNYDDLWIVGPGDFDCTPNTPVTLDTSDPFALSRTYTHWIPQGVGSLRWVDSSNCGGSPVSCPYPELLARKSDLGWGELAKRSVIYGFTEIGPIDTAATPWMYSPFYRKDADLYAATLADPITTTPAVGTVETHQFPDAAAAPLMAGLEITVDSEVMRILTVSGSSVKLYRGSNGTKPATHAAGQVKVSGRRAIGIPASGTITNGYTYQLRTSVPHGQFTGSMSVATIGTGWPQVTWSNGDVRGRLDARFPLVTGPNSLVMWIGPTSNGAGARPIKTYALDPAQCYSQTNYGSYIPPEVTAITTGRFPRAALHVNINLDACDDFVWHYMRLIRDHFPAGRTVIVEYQNEPWNWGFTGYEYCMKAADYVAGEHPYELSYYGLRSHQVGEIARAAFAETGRDAEIKLMLNCQLGSGQPKQYLTEATTKGWKVDRIGNAPYLTVDHFAGVPKAAFATWDDDQLCDLWSVMLWYDASGKSYSQWIKTAKDAISEYNKTPGNVCELMAYEGGIEHAVPTSAPYYPHRGLDLVYNPNWYWFEDTFYRWAQKQGFVNFHVYSLSQYHSPHLWGMMHWPRQRPGYGDGRYGGTDNRLFVARPGQPNSKPSGMNIDLKDSVRGQAFIDWAK